MKKLLVIIALCAFMAAPTFADLYGTATVQYKGMVRGMTLNMTAYSSTYGWITGDLDAGLFELSVTNLSLTTPLPSTSYLAQGNELAFCIDIWDATRSENPEVYYVMSLDATPDPVAAPAGGMGTDKAEYIAELLAKNSYDTALDAAAVQVAIWEVLQESVGSWDVSNTNGDFFLGTGSAEVAVANVANTMLGGLTTGLSFDMYTGLSNGGFKQLQDFVVVPVPAAVLLGLLGMGVAGLKLRKHA
jgi:hypothetical protein